MKKVIICKKLGMTELISENGQVTPVTALMPIENIVVDKKTVDINGYDAIQVGYGGVKANKVSKPHKGQFDKKSLDVYKKLREFRVDDLSEFELGSSLTIAQFDENELVKVSSNSKGRGFSGTIKRWNFARGPMSHGSKSHRITGSIGGGTTPGRVIKGKKMAGRYGNALTSIKNLLVVKIDSDKNLIFVKGAVPGHVDAEVVVAAKAA